MYLWTDALVTERSLGVPPNRGGISGSGAGDNWGVYVLTKHKYGTVHHHEVNI